MISKTGKTFCKDITTVFGQFRRMIKILFCFLYFEDTRVEHDAELAKYKYTLYYIIKDSTRLASNSNLESHCRVAMLCLSIILIRSLTLWDVWSLIRRYLRREVLAKFMQFSSRDCSSKTMDIFWIGVNSKHVCPALASWTKPVWALYLL